MSLLVSGLTARRGFEGPQVVLSFSLPDEAFSKCRIVRKLYDYPQNESDGVIVKDDITGAQGEAYNYSDTDIVGQETYYYRVFTYDGANWHFNLTTRTKMLAIETGYFEEKLYNLMPGIYRLYDIVGIS